DLVSRAGAYSIQQPLIAPLFKGRTESSLLAALGADTEHDPHLLVKATAAARGAVDEPSWQRLLQRGISPRNDAQIASGLSVQSAALAAAIRALPEAAPLGNDALEVVFLADNKLLDGRHANNAWLQELPDPIT